MREIGFIKWYGGYDHQRNRENDFGYIGREGKLDDVKVYREEVCCSESDLKESILVTFETTINPTNNKLYAKKLKLFTEIGRIKNFGININQSVKPNYWFIECEYDGHILVHRKDFNFIETDLTEGTIVKFLIQKYGKEYKAKNVHLFNFREEIDPDIIERCLNHKDPRICALGIWGYINNNSFDKAISLIEQKLKKYSDWEKKRFLNQAPGLIYFYFELKTISPSLLNQNQLNILFQFLTNNSIFLKNISVNEEVLNIFDKIQTTNLSFCNNFIDKYYNLYLDNPIYRKRLRTELQVKCLVKIISNLDSNISIHSLLNELQEAIVNSKSNNIWIAIPNYIILKQPIWSIAPQSRRIGILVSQLSNVQDLAQENKILEIANLLEESTSEEITKIIPILQDKFWIKSHESILKFFPVTEQINILISKLNNGHSKNIETINQLVKLLCNVSSNELDKFIYILPNEVKQNDAVLEFFPAKEQVLILLSKLKEEGQIKNQYIYITNKIGNVIYRAANDERIILIYLLPESIRYKEPILNVLHTLIPEEQVKLVWNFIINGSLLTWFYMSRQAKILCVYRLAKENQNISMFLSELKRIQKTSPENDMLVRCTLKILWAKENSKQCENVFKQVDELLIQYVIETVNTSNELLNLDPLLPYCKPTEVKVKYCEGKLWHKKGNQTNGEAEITTTSYCPRTRNICNLFDPNKKENYNLYGARLYAECSQDWQDWSLLELFQTAGIIPKPEDYIAKLSGWINRINEIRSRFKCSVCGDIMPHNIEYAKFRAKFRVTVFSCQHGGNHDYNIYLNECWGCNAIIDSRESKYQSKEDKYYICIHCGSGTRHSNTYTQGDICPKCGMVGMNVSPSNNRYRQCLSCKHSIKLPDKNKITGPRCPECKTTGLFLTVNQNNELVRMCRSRFCTYSIVVSN
ncbi:hypothetical protein [Nostoc sp. FACHB-110]|uniref:hypothetical protein n=1 Tax=Nostoc sp. FACHB-110 TaxID=2692834 RepID=UPI0016860FAD|nr:hypothetical protein [Nostoc sp. FACHB-110]MBD2439315.1 hypothetical protein [Nostoc sp. FACHB-110]